MGQPKVQPTRGEESARVMPRFDFRVDAAYGTDLGSVRTTNEDAYLFAPELGLFGVADGMGGLDRGELASRTAIEEARRCIAEPDAQKILETYVAFPSLEQRRNVRKLLADACLSAHAKVLALAEGQTIGTTLDLCLLVRDKAFLAHVGDGRVFLARTRATLLVTQDHVTDAGPAFEARRRPRPLTSALGLPTPPRVDTLFVELERGDRLLLLSDGAHGAVDDEASMNRLCMRAPKEAVGEVLQLALARGGRDNATAIAIRVGERFLVRPEPLSQRQNDFGILMQNPLFVGLPPAMMTAALSAGIEIEHDEGGKIRQADAGDLCAYLVVDGVVVLPGGARMSRPALLFAESLVGTALPDAQSAVRAETRTRTVRIRADDFQEMARHDPQLGCELYQRLARHIAQTRG